MALQRLLHPQRQLTAWLGCHRMPWLPKSRPASSSPPPPTSNHQQAASASDAEAVEAPPPPEPNKLLVLGGSGFVGSHICQAALHRRLPVLSLSRSGTPSMQDSWTKEVTWVKGNLFEPEGWKGLLGEVSAIISCVGGFGSNKAMRKINGEANISAVNAASDAGVNRFVYISAHDFGLPSFFLQGYYEGKRAAESALREKFPYGGIILRPGFIHGTRQVGGLKIPLSYIGGPLEMVLRNAKSFGQIPVIGPCFVPPVKASTVANAALRAATDNAIPPGVLDVWGIIRIGDH